MKHKQPKKNVPPTMKKQIFKKIFTIAMLLLILRQLSLTNYLSKKVSLSLPKPPNEKNMMGKPSPNKGFRPVYIYSNHHIADSEVPLRSAVKNRPNLKMPYGQVFQDKIILALSKANDKKNPSRATENKFFVDLAANDAIELSNTLFLEQNGWDGICIEGNPMYWYGLARYRNCTVVGAFIGGSVDGMVAEISLGGVGGGIIGKDFDNKGGEGVKRELVSLKTVFNETNVPNIIDYLNLDVEGAESLIMSDFPWDCYKFCLMTVERPKKDLTDLLSEKGYFMVKTLVSWGETLWANKDLIHLSQEEMLQIIEEHQK